MTLKDEIKRAEDKGLNYTPPYKLAEMMKLSSKIVKTQFLRGAGNE